MRGPQRRSRPQLAIQGMKKAPIVWLLLVIFSTAPCAGLLEAGCCLDDHDHHKDLSGPHRQVLSPFQIVAHALKHLQGQSGRAALASPHFCCIGAHLGEVGQGPHSLKRVRTRPPVGPQHQAPVAAGSSDLGPITSGTHASASSAEPGSRLTLQSIQATVLLI
jgi:hypothetical protein